MDFIERFREALKIPTFWPQGAAPGDREAERPLLQFQEFLARSYPAFHKAAERWVLSPYSVLYRLAGTGQTGEAVLLLAHYDVVAAETEKWSADPFGAEMKDGFIYGRGALDMKGMLVSLMEAAENLCVSGFKPKRDIWIALGGDEERTGVQGGLVSAKWLAGRGRRFSWILDEGSPVALNHIKGVAPPLALVSIEEKGYLSLELSVAQEPGHASRPPETQAAAVLARALCRIDKKPFPWKLVPTVESFFKQIAPFMQGFQSFAMRHARALGHLFFAVAGKDPAIASMLRTTVAMTQLEGSAADNVLPSEALAVINLRLLQPWSADDAANFIKKTVNDGRVKIEPYGLGTGPVAASRDFKRSGWHEIEAALAEAWPGVPMLPFIMVATTDSRHYQELADAIFRFDPYKLDPKEMGGIHGHDERISVENLKQGLIFYTKLVEGL